MSDPVTPAASGLGEAEIARVLDVAPGTVKSQASRALATLRERVALDPVLREEQA